jgi:hypothetical protein
MNADLNTSSYWRLQRAWRSLLNSFTSTLTSILAALAIWRCHFLPLNVVSLKVYHHFCLTSLDSFTLWSIWTDHVREAIFAQTFCPFILIVFTVLLFSFLFSDAFIKPVFTILHSVTHQATISQVIKKFIVIFWILLRTCLSKTLVTTDEITSGHNAEDQDSHPHVHENLRYKNSQEGHRLIIQGTFLTAWWLNPEWSTEQRVI